MAHWTERLQELEACPDAVAWARGYPTLQAAWDACQRGDWMLWLLGQQPMEPGSPEHRLLVVVACECARLGLPYAQGEEARQTIEIVEAWTRGEATLEEVRKAEAAAWAAAWAAAGAAGAAWAAWAARAAWAAAGAAWAAAGAAAEAAAWAARAATGVAGATWAAVIARCADIVRRHFPKAPGEEEGK